MPKRRRKGDSEQALMLFARINNNIIINASALRFSPRCGESRKVIYCQTKGVLRLLYQVGALLKNTPLWTAVIAMALAQVIKVLIERWRTGSWQTALVFSTGGMPSSHSALTVSLMLSIGWRLGFDSAMFALCAVLAMVVMYDAAGVRRAAGSHAEAINFLFQKLERQGIKLDKKFKEMLGHKPVEVLGGAILGVIVSLTAEWLVYRR